MTAGHRLIENHWTLPFPAEKPDEEHKGLYRRVMLFLELGHRNSGEAEASAVDKGVIPAVSSRLVPIDFSKSTRRARDAGLQGARTPGAHTYVVDIQATFSGGEVQGYVVLNEHDYYPRPPSCKQIAGAADP